MSTVKPIEISRQKTHWMKFDNKSFKTQDDAALDLSNNSAFRNVHDTQEATKNKSLSFGNNDKAFFDPQWDIRVQQDLSALSLKKDDRIILRRLGHIYPTNQLRPKFFPEDGYNQPLLKVTDVNAVPHALHQISLFSANYYKSLFLTQDYEKSGLYHMIVNFNGRWETDVVDDLIPIYQKSGKPIWEMDLQQPWQLILIKFWAKRLYVHHKIFHTNQMGGYAGIPLAAPFSFVENFTNSTWKFTNLSLDGQKFLRSNVNKIHKGHFILKTKNSDIVSNQGLVRNQACYELVSLVEQGQSEAVQDTKIKQSQVKGASNVNGTSIVQSKVPAQKKNQPKNYIATIRSINKNKWTGNKSVVEKDFMKNYSNVLTKHKEISKIRQERTDYDENSQRFGIDRYFTMDGKDLVNLFSYVYVTPRRLGTTFYTNYFKFKIPANRKKAVYLQFNMPKDGFFDFSIKQSIENKVKAGQKSKVIIQAQKQKREQKQTKQTAERYLKCKYILMKDNKKSGKSPTQEQFQKQYNQLNYQTYQIQYMKGYNTGDAHFLRAVQGRYILRIKSQKATKDAEYIVSYSCQHNIAFKEYIPTIEQETTMLKDAMSSNIDKVERSNLRNKDDNQIIAYGNTFDYVGYGFIGAKLKKTSKRSLLIDVDPILLNKQGFSLKGKYKNEKQPFAFIVKPGQATTVVLKRIDQANIGVFPPKGVAVFEKSLQQKK